MVDNGESWFPPQISQTAHHDEPQPSWKTPHPVMSYNTIRGAELYFPWRWDDITKDRNFSSDEYILLPLFPHPSVIILGAETLEHPRTLGASFKQRNKTCSDWGGVSCILLSFKTNQA